MGKQSVRRIALIGQAPPWRPTVVPFARSRLYDWFAEVGWTRERVLEQVYFTALVSSHPGRQSGRDRAPSQAEIGKHRQALLREVRCLNPRLVIPVGKLAIREVLDSAKMELSESVGELFLQEPFGTLGYSCQVIPLPHPSRGSTWPLQDKNRVLLARALAHIRSLLGSTPI